MKLIQLVWKDIQSGKNIDIYLAIFLSLVVGILGIIGTANPTIVASAVLATLALVSNGLLVNRRENEAIRNLLSSIDSGKNLSSRFLKREYDRSGLRKILQNSHSAFFWGPYLTTHIQILNDVIDERLQDGLQVRFLLLEPSNSGAATIALNRTDKNIFDVDKTIEKNLFRLKRFQDRQTSGKLEARVLNYIPPFSIIAFDPNLPSGRLFVRLNSFGTPNEKRPTFELLRKDDADWFMYFVDQFESAWQKAHEPLVEAKT